MGWDGVIPLILWPVLEHMWCLQYTNYLEIHETSEAPRITQQIGKYPWENKVTRIYLIEFNTHCPTRTLPLPDVYVLGQIDGNYIIVHKIYYNMPWNKMVRENKHFEDEHAKNIFLWYVDKIWLNMDCPCMHQNLITLSCQCIVGPTTILEPPWKPQNFSL